MATTLLSFSRDSLVLRTCNLILRAAGYEVVVPRDEQEALAIAQSRHLDAVVLGDSIPYPQRNGLVEALNQICPDAAIVAITRPAENIPASPSYCVGSLDGPAELLATLKRALAHRSNVAEGSRMRIEPSGR